MEKVRAGLRHGQGAIQITDCRKAIRAAVVMAHWGDVKLGAGKVHETYPIRVVEKRNLDDRAEILAALGG